MKKKVAVLGNGSPLFQEKVENVGKGRKVVPPRGYPQGTKLYSSCDATSALSLLLEEEKKDSDTPSPFQCFASSVLPSAMTRDQKLI